LEISPVTENNSYSVIDLFAGPGGLGEGFASLRQPKDKRSYAFRTALSIEKDPDAHRTLKLRHFFREFPPEDVPDDYYQYLADNISLDELYLFHPAEEVIAAQKAWLCTLGVEPVEHVRKRISDVIADQRRWVLVGGPPCQAYSLVGRSRMMGMPEFESDPRHFLYKQYLRILADHKPPVFVMENVKGLLSAKISGDFVVKNIVRDLMNPEYAIYEKQSGIGYKLYSLSEPGEKNIEVDASSFTVKAEEYGIPQARHRILILGIRDDINVIPRTLEKSTTRYRVKDVIGDMPRLRSTISKSSDSFQLWKTVLAEITNQEWYTQGKTEILAELARRADTFLLSICQADLKTSDKTYSTPHVLSDWFKDERLTTLSSHESRGHMPSDLHRYFFAALYAGLKGISPKLSDFPEELLPIHKNVEQGVSGKMFSDRFRVQLSNAPSTTITSHISKDGHYFIHYDPVQCRSLTVREAARLQTFPDNYKFEGMRTAQYHQVGNAVPPLLANKIAEIIYEVLEGVE